MAHHSSVNYVEPNYISNDDKGMPWKVDDGFERAPRLEDYCITLNIEVEICGRSNISQSRKTSSEVLVLSYSTKQDGSESTVNFLGGTKVSTGKGNYQTVPYLTTNYADMYVGDLINYGTTEMIGIKSVDIEYQRGCVPIINIVFTDVRGLSLFQPTELSRTKEYQGIGGINADNVAQSFFQCFFKLPMPKFTITIKGFYGNPVTYEVLCDKFDTKFNSATGDFDVTTRFIGYSYSFLTDISIDALFAAPYSDYQGGKDYWDKQKASGRFALWNKEKTVKKEMPTLFEVWQEMKEILKHTASGQTALTYEETTHEMEIADLQDILDKARRWYNSLFDVCCAKYGKEYCYLFKEDGADGEPYKILILTNKTTEESGKFNLSYDYEDFPDSFKQETQSLFSAIESYNSNGSNFKKLDNVSENLADYGRRRLFNNCYLNYKGEVIFNGFHEKCRLPKTLVTKHVFYGVDYVKTMGEWDDINDVKRKETQHKKHVLSVIYNGGIDQYVDCYDVDFDYREIRNRINALQADSNKSVKEREHEKRVKEVNKIMFEKMSWYPSVENFTRLMVAHLETLMRMMYNVVNDCGNRTATQLGVSVGDDGNISDVKSGIEIIPPFPKATKQIIDDDGITKFEDCWVGEFNGQKPFAEVDFVDGLFNAAERLQALYKEMQEKEKANENLAQPQQNTPIVRFPTSSFDFYLTESPYGDSSEISNDVKGFGFAAKVGIRMSNILGISNFKRDFASNTNSPWNNGDVLKSVARAEAENFYSLVRLDNINLITMIRDGVITAESVMKILTDKNTDADCPWGTTKPLFSSDNSIIRLTHFNTKNGNLYPIQGYKISDAITHSNALKDGKVGNYNGTMSLSTIPNECVGNLPNDKSGMGTAIIYDDFSTVTKYVEGGNSYGSSDEFSTFYKLLQSACGFVNDEIYGNFIKYQLNPSVTNSVIMKMGQENKDIKPSYFKINNDKAILFGKKDGKEVELGDYNISNTYSFCAQSQRGTFEDYTISEIFSYEADNDGYLKLIDNSSYKASPYVDKMENSVNGITIGANEKNLTRLILGVKLNTTNISNYLSDRKTVNYIPRLAALQIGAIIYHGGGVKECGKQGFLDAVKKKIPTQSYQEGVIRLMSSSTKMVYMKYYVDWVKSKASKFLSLNNNDNYIFPSDESNKRRVLKEDAQIVKDLTSELLSPICIVNLSYAHDALTNEKVWNYGIDRGKAEQYLRFFIEKLKELYKIDYTEDSNGNLVKTTDEPKKTTNEMKAELYRYMKQIYDKWIPMSSFDDWKLESFFNDSSNAEENGHKFYFIDSYYNDISHKVLVNPKMVSEKVEALLDYKDVSSMMLGFMSDIYNSNKCMLMSIQNFADLKKDGCMNEMFTPKSFNSIDWIHLNKYPSFVVVYPYSPSRNLDVDGSEYKNDSFMLNDEFETPTAIKSKTGEQMKIPAFGVTYGKQYQSYFKSININMSSPIETEQSIKAKHYIIREQASTKNKGVVAQDLYDIYSSRSYMCEVEMMGCAWVQPLMYFVLLNVPVFKGSYMIMKVKHSIKPGDMTTQFTGCRMAKSSTKLVENIFTDEDMGDDDSTYNAYESEFTEKADIDNNCPYKIYPLFSNTDSSDIKARILKEEGGWVENDAGKGCTMKGVNIRVYREVFGNNKTCDELHNISDSEWDTIFKKRFLDPVNYDQIDNKSIADFIVDWGYNCGTGGCIKRIRSIFGNDWVTAINSTTPQKAAFDKLWNNRKDYYVDLAKSPKYSGYLNTWMRRIEGFSYSDNPSNSVSSNGSEEVDYQKALFEALKKTCRDTPSINTEIIALYNKNNLEIGYTVKQKDGKDDKLHLVFDVLLNSEYHKYVSEIVWSYDNGGLENDANPVSVNFKASQNVEPNKQRVYIVKSGDNISNAVKQKVTKDSVKNSLLLKSLAKRLNAVGNADVFKKEVPQVQDSTILDEYMPQDCRATFGGLGGGGTFSTNSNWAKSVQIMGKAYENNIHTYQSSNPGNKGTGKRKQYQVEGINVYDDCSGYVSACLTKFGAFKNEVPSSRGFVGDSNIASILEKNKFQKMPYSWNDVQPYDIIAYNGHVEILAEKGDSPKSWGWGSVHDGQNGRSGMPAKTGNKPKGNTYTTIWRYMG